MMSGSDQFSQVFRPKKTDSISQFVQKTKSQSESVVKIEFLPYECNTTENLKATQVYKWLTVLKKQKVAFERPQDRPIPDQRLDQVQADWDQRKILCEVRGADPLISIIVPSFRNKNYLIALLRHLEEQTLAPKQFEVLIMDDGSDDGSFEAVRAYLQRSNSQLSWIYAYCPRQKPRQRMDATFRAGWLRNWGVELARGAELVFMDSDILVEPLFLEKLIEQRRSADVVQHVRLHIPALKSHEAVQYSRAINDLNLYIEEESYWKPFFETARWMQIPDFWKYSCTYCFSLSKAAFLSVGGFNKNFVFYGFEDTDLGYRLAKGGFSFQLAKNPVLHLTPPQSESEFAHSKWQRHRLLKRSAKMFFLLHLDTHIFETFRSYMDEDFAL